MHDNKQLCSLALAVVETQAAAIQALTSRIDQAFINACECLLACTGRIIVIGMGKSGHIARKIAATLASTGSPAFFVHAAEASHGDMGMITSNDIVLAISYSGRTGELITLIPRIKRLGVPLIALTGYPDSPLATAADIHLDTHVEKEACPLGLAPTTSTTATLVMGDALAISLLQARGFTADDFALSHPGGTLGRRLLLRIDDIMHTGDAIPRVDTSTLLSNALVEMTQKKLGLTTIVNSAGILCGIFTDGDLRRTLDNTLDIHTTPIQTVMTAHCKTIKKGMLASEALHIMELHKITALVVIDDEHKPIGILHMHDLLHAGVA